MEDNSSNDIMVGDGANFARCKAIWVDSFQGDRFRGGHIFADILDKETEGRMIDDQCVTRA